MYTALLMILPPLSEYIKYYVMYINSKMRFMMYHENCYNLTVKYFKYSLTSFDDSLIN